MRNQWIMAKTIGTHLEIESENRSFKIPALDVRDALAEHLFHSFHGEVDDFEESLSDWQLEVKAFFEGKYGAFLNQHSFYIEDSGKIIGCVLVSLYNGITPLVIYLAVDPHERGKGYAQSLLKRMIVSFQGSAYSKVYLVVTQENRRAKKMYDQLDFKVVGTDWDQVL
jgi:ribosomal protein S18 acetylase RimI-like enzyme